MIINPSLNKLRYSRMAFAPAPAGFKSGTSSYWFLATFSKLKLFFEYRAEAEAKEDFGKGPLLAAANTI